MTKKIESVMNCFLPKKRLEPVGFIAKWIKTIVIFFRIFLKTKYEGILNSFHETCITLMPITDTDTNHTTQQKTASQLHVHGW
jgi:hypothetical protein